jgi:hypothetical protein
VSTPTITPSELAEYGWIRRPSGRYVHPELSVEGARDRLRVFTEGEALTLTASLMQGRCDECGAVHDTDDATPEVEA